MMKFILLFCAILLSSCQFSSDKWNVEIIDTNSHIGTEYKNKELDYTLNLPEVITEVSTWTNSITSEEGPFFGSKIESTIDPPFGGRDIRINVHNSPTSCSSTAIGISDPITLNEANTESIWGKVYDDRGMGNTPSRDALCGYPQASRECQSIGEGCDDGVGAYAFCSEKENFLGIGEPKRVVICISQQTDDSKMAEEIFKTFKWIK